MSQDEQFLRAIHADPADSTVRLVYSDWLEEQGDPRGEYLRLEAQLAALPAGDVSASGVRKRMIEMHSRLPAEWLAFLGDQRTTGCDCDVRRIEMAARVLGRPAQYVDDEGATREIIAAATNGMSNALAYVESRAQQRGNRFDITFHLRVRDQSGKEAARAVETYNAYFGCRVRFLEWYMNVVLMIYREKHKTYICRFGIGSSAKFKTIGDDWVLDGRQLGYWGYKETSVRRLALPGLEDLPPLSVEEAARWDLLPRQKTPE
jgi:uncharacterized protein (TIGR02996 family)